MESVRRALSVAVGFGGVLPALCACQGMGTGLGILLNVALALGMAVGTYFLIQELN
jgi:hypothetical protein